MSWDSVAEKLSQSDLDETAVAQPQPPPEEVVRSG